MRFSIDEYKVDRTKRNKISYPCTTNINKNTDKQANKQTNKNKFTHFITK